MVMDLVEGANLRVYVNNVPPLKEEVLIDLALQCCSILDYLHSQAEPILHRDFTPDNLMITRGAIKLIDFSIAQSAVTSASPTVMGKHCFMAPEQFCGESSKSTDLYQLGSTLYYLASATDPEPLMPCDLGVNRKDLSNEFLGIVRRLTDRHPSKRFTSAGDVANLLSRIAKANSALYVKGA